MKRMKSRADRKMESVPGSIKIVTALVFALVAAWAFFGAPNPHEGGKTNDSALVAQAKQSLGSLKVEQPDRNGDYERIRFGESWEDVDGNGCYTRNDVLIRDLSDVEFRPGSNCVVIAGKLVDPYTNQTIEFSKSRSEEVQIDHVVALAEAWRSGAWAWNDNQRLQFANDPLNLLAVSGEANDDKASADAAGWLPPNKDFRCDYVARQVIVKQKYALTVDSRELKVISQLLDGCKVS